MALRLYTHSAMLGHEVSPRHPERPARLEAVTGALAAMELERCEAPAVAAADLERVHTPRYLAALEQARPREGIARIDADTQMSAGSLDAARRAAGAVVAAVRAVAAGEAERAFCAVRPPGHHAGPEFPMGFCLYSNIAIGARAAQAAGLARIAVADFDVHHGNGTQAVFEEDESLFLASVHQSPLWPGTGDPTDRGPKGNIANVTVAPHAAREAWREAFAGLVARIDAFAPDMILISAGFDAHARDPLAHQSLEAEDFAWATRAVVEVARVRCGGKIVSSLEGGYDLEGLGRSAAAHVAALQDP